MEQSTNRDRRKLLAVIFADTAKYSLTAGVLGTFIGEKMSYDYKTILVLGNVTTLCCIAAYFVTPKNKEG